MFRRISFFNKKGFLQKRDNFSKGFLFSPVLLIPLFLVIISGFLIKSIQGEFLVSNYLSHILTGFFGYFLAFFISYIPLERLRKYVISFYLVTLIKILNVSYSPLMGITFIVYSLAQIFPELILPWTQFVLILFHSNQYKLHKLKNFSK